MKPATCRTCKFWRPDDWDGEPGDCGRCACEGSEYHGMMNWHDEGCDEHEPMEAGYPVHQPRGEEDA